MAAAATARKAAAPARRAAPRRAAAPARKPAPARRTAPARRRPAPSRRPGGQLIPLAVGTATAVRRFPDSGLMVQLTRGRAWIGLLGLLLAGIVALNVVTLSLGATASRVDASNQALDRENSILRARDAQRSGAARVRHDAAALGLTSVPAEEAAYVRATPDDVATAARRLAAAGSAY